MKKILLAAAAALTALVACQKNEVAAPAADSVLYATIEETDATKTYMDAHNNIRWSEGDQIIAFMKSSYGHKYQVKSSFIGETYADFSKVSSSNGDDLSAGMDWDHIVAYYPYAESIKCAKSGNNYALNVILPSEQTYAAESFGNGSMAMVAVSEDNNITFRNVLGGMKLQLKGTQNVKSIKLEGKNNEKLSGAATVTAYTDETKPAITMTSGASTSVTLDCGSGVQLNESNATEFIITIPPTVFTKGFTVTFNYIDGKTYKIDTEKENDVIRSSLLVMPEITLDNSSQEESSERWVDLGLSVLWAAYNVGASSPEEYGGYYAWGETSTKSDYTWENYEYRTYYYGDGPDDWCWTGRFIGNEISGTSYDVAHVQWGGGARMPTFAEVQELVDNCTFTGGSYNGVRGSYVTGPNGNNIFLPFAAFRNESTIVGTESNIGYFWSGTYYYDDYGYRAYYLHCHGDSGKWGYYDRSYGKSVRPVTGVSYVNLNSTSLKLYEGDIAQLTATVGPEDATDKTVVWSSDMPSVATVDQSGLVTGISAGSANISASAGGKVAKCTVTVWSRAVATADYIDEYGVNHGQGVEIDGVVWAPVNCGYHKDDFKYGKLYQWGRKYGQGYSGSFYDINGNKAGKVSDARIPTIEEGGIDIWTGNHGSKSNIFFTPYPGYGDWVDSQYDYMWNRGTESSPDKTGYDPCPEGWRVPTYAELGQLSKNHSSRTKGENGQVGYWFSGASTYTETVPQVFFPAAGYRSGGDVYPEVLDAGTAHHRGYRGYYWSSRPSSYLAYHLRCYSSTVEMTTYYRAGGYSVRCVQE